MKKVKKILKVLGVLLAIFICLAVFFYYRYQPTFKPVWGINFSTGQARYLGFNPEELYGNILDDLAPKKVRLMVYWEDIEAQQGQFDFSLYDRLLRKSDVAGTKVTLAVGHKEPRWPECHHPDWYNKLDKAGQRQAVLALVKAEVEHFKNSPAVERWQVENEPFFNYGSDCATLTSQELQDEIAEVKLLDERPVVATDSGEKGLWLPAANLADVFGTTMYRTVYQGNLNRYITYPLPPAWYRVRAGMAESLTSVKDVIDVELQAEPWFQSDVRSFSTNDLVKLMDVQKLNQNIQYARATGLPEHFLWGAEWWYYMAGHGHPEYLETAEKLMAN